MEFHSRLTIEQETDLERIQKTSLKIILNESYIDYKSALEMSGITSLKKEREAVPKLCSEVY